MSTIYHGLFPVHSWDQGTPPSEYFVLSEPPVAAMAYLAPLPIPVDPIVVAQKVAEGDIVRPTFARSVFELLKRNFSKRPAASATGSNPKLTR